MKYDTFSKCHPAVNFLYFVGAIGFGVVIHHPAYLTASILSAAIYYLLLNGKKGWKMILGLLPMFLLLTAINPLLNTQGAHILFHLFGRPYTAEALLYGAAIAGIFVVTMLWFGCSSAVLTSDKFTSLFGNLIPALSLLLVMVLRMIPNLIRKAKQIAGCRRSIGRGTDGNSSLNEQLTEGMTVLSSLTDWALEGSVITADSMRARGYGTAKRTTFQIYRMTRQDWLLLAFLLTLAAAVLFGGSTTATYTPELSVSPLGWGFGAYCVYLLIPTALHIKETVSWHISRSRI